MKYKNLYFLLFCTLIGVILGNFMLKQYRIDKVDEPVNKSVSMVYFFEYGTYSSEEEMKEKTMTIPYYIYREDDGKYYVYVGMTANDNNKEKLMNYFNNLGYSTIIKEYTVHSEAFLEVLAQYDIMLEQTEGDTISAIESQVLGKYEELVVSD